MTAAELVEGALRKIGVMDAGDTVPAATKVVGLTALNRLLSAWSTQPRSVNKMTTDTLTLTPGDGEYSIGPAGNIVTVRPSKVANVNIRSGNIDYPLKRISVEDYSDISDKTTLGIPEFYVYDPQSPEAIIYLWPLPDSAYQLRIVSYKPLQVFTSLSDVVTLPQEYYTPIEWNLAAILAPEFGQEASRTVVAMAESSYKAMQDAIKQPVRRACSSPFVVGRLPDINSGY